MSYAGTTIGTTAINLPYLIARPMAVQTSSAAVMGTTGLTGSVYGGMSIWGYDSTDTSTLIQAPGYFIDGQKLGMRVGDVMVSKYFSSLGATPSNVQVGILVTTNSTAGFNVAIGANIASS